MFIDESGLLTSPLVRRTWAPCGKTPVFRQKGRSYQKVSVLAAICVSPMNRRYRLFFRFHKNISINKSLVNQFLGQLERQLRRPAIVLWDRLQVHRSALVQGYIRRSGKLWNEFFPSYAPELNPVEYVWGWIKMNPLANQALEDAESIASAAYKHGRAVQHNTALLRSFIRKAGLFF